MTTDVPGPEVWGAGAACRGMDPDLFHPQGSGVPVGPEAAAACARCPVVEQCQTYALHHEKLGYWGGTSAYERALMRKAQGIELSALDGPIVLLGRHGTRADYRRHLRRHEPPCRACTRANALYKTELRRAGVAS